MKAYRIKNWDRHYEIAQSRACKSTSWVAVPNSHESVGYSILATHERFPEIFAAWILILQLASKMPVRGELVNGSRTRQRQYQPLTPRTMAIRTRCNRPDIFELALKVLCEDEIGWLEEFDYEPTDVTL